MEYNKKRKIMTNEIIGHFLRADITKIKEDKLHFDRDFVEKHITEDDTTN